MYYLWGQTIGQTISFISSII